MTGLRLEIAESEALCRRRGPPSTGHATPGRGQPRPRGGSLRQDSARHEGTARLTRVVVASCLCLAWAAAYGQAAQQQEAKGLVAGRQSVRRSDRAQGQGQIQVINQSAFDSNSTVLGFDDLASGTILGSLYEHEGIIFDNAVVQYSPLAPSPPNDLSAVGCSIGFPSVCPPNTPPLTFHFPNGVKRVGVQIDTDGYDSDRQPQIRAFDANGELLPCPTCAGGLAIQNFAQGPDFEGFEGVDGALIYKVEVGSVPTGNPNVFEFSDGWDNVTFEGQGLSTALVDPVPKLLCGEPAVISPTAMCGEMQGGDLLATQGTVVQGAAADGVTEVVLRISGVILNDQVTLTLMNDHSPPGQSQSADEDGALGNPGDTSFTQSQITVTAVSTTNNGPMAFAIYRAPIDFVRPSSGTGSCGGSPTTDDQLACRSVSIQVQDLTTQVSSTTTLQIVRPPVVLVHGIWDDSTTWNSFSPLFDSGLSADARFYVYAVDYSYRVGENITATVPPYSPLLGWAVSGAGANALGFAYNAYQAQGGLSVADNIEAVVEAFKSSSNPLQIWVAAIQADIVAHSMGGDITRTLPLQKGFLSDNTLGQGNVHKVITIDTPHLGTPLAIDLLQDGNTCVRNLLAVGGNIAFSSVTLSGQQVNGAVGDLEGDGTGGGLSTALGNLQQTGFHQLPTALISGVVDSTNLDSLSTSFTANVIFQICGVLFGDPLAQALTPKGWPTVFGQASDAIAPLSSQLANTSPNGAEEFFGYVHSGGTERLGFTGPAVLPSADDVKNFTKDQVQRIPNEVITLLNTPVTQPVFNRLNP